jgi:deazaflavin-dependent oxidoreductase (nitroreductase family)
MHQPPATTHCRGQNGGMSSIVKLVRTMIAPITRTRLFRLTAPRVMPTFERWISSMSGGRVQLSGLLVHSLVLHTTGAHTGIERHTELMYTPDGHGRAIVAGTSFAREHHPAWTYNLIAHPDAAITVRGRRLTVRATRIGDDAREEAWRLIQQQWPGYRAYERESGRRVRLFLLQPVREPGSSVEA